MYLHVFIIFPVVVCAGVNEDYKEIHSEVLPPSQGIVMQGIFDVTVKRFHCRAYINQNQKPLLYGTKAWSFPLQDVNLTLQYPPANRSADAEEYIITEIKVIMYMDGGVSTKGYVTGGGMLQTNVRMTFILPRVTRISYQFWLYGVPKRQITEPIIRDNACE